MQVGGTLTSQVIILDAACNGVYVACKFQECADAHGLVSYAKCIETSGGSLEDGFLHLTDVIHSQSRSECTELCQSCHLRLLGALLTCGSATNAICPKPFLNPTMPPCTRTL
jgi:hypothetical protein